MTKKLSKDQLIENKLQNCLEMQFLEINNKSNSHSGHAGDDGSGESHYEITISCKALESLSRIQKHRKIFEVLGEEIVKNTHSISLKFK